MGCQECVSPCFSLPNLHCHMFRFTQHHCFDVAALFAKLEASLANLQPISKGGCDKQYKRTTCIELRYLRGSRQDSSPCHLAPDCWIFLCVWGQHLLVLFTASGRKKAPLSKPVRIRDKLSEWICRSCKQYFKKGNYLRSKAWHLLFWLLSYHFIHILWSNATLGTIHLMEFDGEKLLTTGPSTLALQASCRQIPCRSDARE